MEIEAGNVPMETPGRLSRKSLPGGWGLGRGSWTKREPHGSVCWQAEGVKGQSGKDQLKKAGKLMISTKSRGPCDK